MIYFAEKFKRASVEEGNFLLAWTGQAGFMLKNSKGKVMALDVYLSDLVEKEDNRKRLMPALFSADEIVPDVVLASHHHADHLDMEILPFWLSEGASLYCCEASGQLCCEADMPKDHICTMKPGDRTEQDGYKVEAVFADHGDTAPKAIGFVVETEGIRLYFTGDTSYQHMRMQPVTERKIDVLILPINGEYGNMNEKDAVMLAAQTGAGLTIPCHFWTFARHSGDPYLFEQEMKVEAPDAPCYVMAQGEILDIEANGQFSRRQG